MQTSLVALLILAGAALLLGVLATASVAGGALRRALRFAALASRRIEPISGLDSGIRAFRGFVGLASQDSSRVPLTSPLTGRPCVFYELTVRHGGKRLSSQREALPCVVNDGSAEIELDLAGVELELEPRSWKGAPGRSLPPTLAEGISERLGALARGGQAGEVELVERAVHVGDRLHVTGTIISSGGCPSFMTGRPIAASDKPFGERARRDALVALAGVGLALFVVSAVVSLFAAALERL